MKFLKKSLIGSLIIVLASFAGGFCVHPMTARAVSPDVSMNASQSALRANESGCTSLSSDEISNTVDLCTSDCVTKAPQTINAKKAAVDYVHNAFAGGADDQNAQTPDIFFGSVRSSGTHPPSPDILSSVVKIE